MTIDENEPTDEEIERLAEAELLELLNGTEEKEMSPEIYCGLWSVN